VVDRECYWCLFNCDNHNMFNVLSRTRKGGREGVRMGEDVRRVVWKLVSWNVRGLGGLEKRKEVMLLVGEKVLFILYLQDTKLQLFDDFLCASLWGNAPCAFSYINRLLRHQEVCWGCEIFLKWRFGPLSMVITLWWYTVGSLNPMRSFTCSMCMLLVIIMRSKCYRTRYLLGYSCWMVKRCVFVGVSMLFGVWRNIVRLGMVICQLTLLLLISLLMIMS